MDIRDPKPLRWFTLLFRDQYTLALSSHLSLDAVSVSKSTQRTLAGSLFDGLPLPVGLSTSFTPPTVTPAETTARILQELQIAPITAVTDFLSSVLEVSRACLERTYGHKFVQSSRVEYVLTIPTIGGDSTKDLMVQAAEKAGFGSHRRDFNILSELESAATYTLKVVQPNGINVSVPNYTIPKH